MVYEIFFRATDGEITLAMFQNYFSKFPYYTVTGPEAVYENKNTGAHFVFRYMHMDGEGNKNVRPEGTYRIALNVNYCVPAFFIMEALYEVDTLIQATKVVMYDAQLGGIGTGAYDGEKMFDKGTRRPGGPAYKLLALMDAQPRDMLSRLRELNSAG